MQSSVPVRLVDSAKGINRTFIDEIDPVENRKCVPRRR